MLSKIFNASTEFMFWLLISPRLIDQTSLSRVDMELSSGVNDITILGCIGFSKLSQDLNPSVAKEDMVNIVCFTLYKRAS